MATEILPLKACSVCKETFPATTEYFHKKRSGLQPKCKKCACEFAQRYRCDNPNAFKEYYKQSPEYHRARSKRWREDNLEYAREYDRNYYAEHREVKLIKAAEYKETHKAEQAIYYVSIRDRLRVKEQKRRALKAAAGGSFTDEDVSLQHKTQKGLCWWCGKALNGKYEIDHRIALSRGGSNGAGNIVLAHRRCNRSKQAKMPWEFNGRLL